MTTLASIKRTLEAYDAPTDAHREFKAALMMYMTLDLPPPNEEILSNIREEFTVEFLYNPIFLRGPSVLHRIFRYFLVHLGMEYVQYPCKSFITYGLLNSFLESDEDKSYALSQLQASKSNSRVVLQQASQNESQAMSGSDIQRSSDRKAIASLATKFKKDDRFSGKLGEYINEVICNYRDACLDFSIRIQC